MNIHTQTRRANPAAPAKPTTADGILINERAEEDARAIYKVEIEKKKRPF